MMTGKEDLLQALVEAYIMEKGTQEFYSRAAAVSVASARKGFESLAAWEMKHMSYLQSLYLSVTEERDLSGFEEFSRKAPAAVLESGMPVKDLEKKIERIPVESEKDALSLAVTIEAKAYNLYKDLAARTQDLSAKVVFEEMMAQETKHMHEIAEMKKRLGA